MPRPTLESMSDQLDRICMFTLGEIVSYSVVGAIYEPVTAYVNYRDAAKMFETAEAIDQDITISLLKSDVTGKPDGKVRIRLNKLPNRTFKPTSVRTDDSGTHWEFEVVDTIHA